MPVKKLALAALLATVVILYFAAGGDQFLSIRLYQGLFDQSPIRTAAVFFLIYFVGTSCSLPVAGVLSVVSGIIFGPVTGFLISLWAGTLGGTIALFSTRFLFHDLIKRRFSVHLDVINKGIEKEGAFYLFGLRMVPVIPFWLLNLLVGMTSMRVPVFFIATLCGMVPITLILVYTGSQLGDIETFSMAAIFTPGLILSLCLLA
ncbi:MAG: VTT domain-containing protein, partial [Xanthomonadales bacterium]